MIGLVQRQYRLEAATRAGTSAAAASDRRAHSAPVAPSPVAPLPGPGQGGGGVGGLGHHSHSSSSASLQGQSHRLQPQPHGHRGRQRHARARRLRGATGAAPASPAQEARVAVVGKDGFDGTLGADALGGGGNAWAPPDSRSPLDGRFHVVRVSDTSLRRSPTRSAPLRPPASPQPGRVFHPGLPKPISTKSSSSSVRRVMVKSIRQSVIVRSCGLGGPSARTPGGTFPGTGRMSLAAASRASSAFRSPRGHDARAAFPSSFRLHASSDSTGLTPLGPAACRRSARGRGSGGNRRRAMGLAAARCGAGWPIPSSW